MIDKRPVHGPKDVGLVADAPAVTESATPSLTIEGDALEIFLLRSPAHLETDTSKLKIEIGELISRMDIEQPGVFGRLFSKRKTSKSTLDGFLLHLRAQCIQTDPTRAKKHAQDMQQSVRALWNVTYCRESSEEERLELINQICERQLLPLLVKSMPLLDFDSRIKIAQIVSNLVRHEQISKLMAKPDLQQDFLRMLVSGAQQSRYPLPYLDMLEVCMFREKLAAQFLKSGLLAVLLHKLCLSPDFAISSGAFAVVQRFFIPPKKSKPCDRRDAALMHIKINQKSFFEEMRKLLAEGDYAQQRLTLDILRPLFSRDENLEILMSFISDLENLKSVMMLMNIAKPRLCIDAYHIFKLFVVNPEMPRDIQYVLYNNKEKLKSLLLAVLTSLQNVGFDEDTKMVLTAIDRLSPPKA